MKNLWKPWMGWCVVIAAVFFLLLTPAVPKFLSRNHLLFNDVFMHTTLFSACYLLATAIWKNPISQFLLVTLLSILTEYLQQYTGRSFEWSDMGANFIGVFAGFAFYQLLLTFPYFRSTVSKFQSTR